jgi:hypothetical protein
MARLLPALLFSALVAAGTAMPMTKEIDAKGNHISPHQHHHGNEVERAAHDMSKLTLRTGTLHTTPTHHAGRSRETMQVDPHHPGKKLQYRITNVVTGEEEQYDPRKHLFNPDEHHPDLAKQAKAKFYAKHVGKMGEDELRRKHNSLYKTYTATSEINEPGGAVLDHNGQYVYSHRSVDKNQALAMHKEGTVKKLRLDEDGELHVGLSDQQRAKMSEGIREFNRKEAAAAKEWDSRKVPLTSQFSDRFSPYAEARGRRFIEKLRGRRTREVKQKNRLPSRVPMDVSPSSQPDAMDVEHKQNHP